MNIRSGSFLKCWQAIFLSRHGAYGLLRTTMAGWIRLSIVVVASAVVSGALAVDDSISVLERARKLEADGMSLLSDHYRFEEGLLSDDNDRVLVLLSLPHGARVIIDEVVLKIDGKAVERFVYSASELLKLQRRATQMFYVHRMPRGEHTLMVEVKVMQGTVVPMQPYSFTKGRTSKFIEILIAGTPQRQIDIQEW